METCINKHCLLTIFWILLSPVGFIFLSSPSSLAVIVVAWSSALGLILVNILLKRIEHTASQKSNRKRPLFGKVAKTTLSIVSNELHRFWHQTYTLVDNCYSFVEPVFPSQPKAFTLFWWWLGITRHFQPHSCVYQRLETCCQPNKQRHSLF